MRITRLEIENFCQHASRDDQLCKGLVGIVGPNGSGKSNYIKSILFAITGSSSNAGKKEDDLTWGQSMGYVKASFEAGGKEGSVKRWIKSSKVAMVYAGDEYRSASAVEERMLAVSGLNFNTLRDMIFVPQGRMESLLFQTPASRAAAFQLLFGTANAESIRTNLQMELVKLEGTVKAGEKTVEELNRSLAHHVQTGKDFEKAKDSLERRLISAEERARLRKLVEQYVAYPRKKREADQYQQQANDYRARHVHLLEELRAAKAQKAEIEQVLKESDGEYKEAKRKLEQALVIEERIKALKALLEERARLEKMFEEVPPEGFTGDARILELEAGLEQLRPSVAASRKIVTAFKSGAAQCPTCLQDVPAQMVESHRSFLKANEVNLQALEVELIGLRRKKADLEGVVARFSARKNSAIERIRDIDLQRVVYKDAETSALAGKEDAQQIVGLYQDLSKQLVELNAKVSTAASQAEHYGRATTEAEERLARAKEDLGEEVDVQTYTSAKGSLDQDGADQLKIAEYSGQIDLCRRSAAETTARITEIVQAQANADKYKSWKSLCTRTRELFHRDRLPNIVANHYLGSINARMAKYLEMFGVPYSVRVNSELEIICSFGTMEVPAERLSGGQKVELSLAFRFAIYDLFSGNLGLLVLDEPTVFLDTDRIDSVCRLMTMVRSYSQSAGLQVIVVTHEQRLAEVCDCVIRMGG